MKQILNNLGRKICCSKDIYVHVICKLGWVFYFPPKAHQNLSTSCTFQRGVSPGDISRVEDLKLC